MKSPSFVALLVACAALLPSSTLQAAPPAPDPDDGAIKLPPGFRALVVADNLGPLRFLTVAPNGDVYVKTREVGIIALRDADGDGRAELKEAFGSGGGTGIALRDGFLYHSTNSSVLRYRMTPGELVPDGTARDGDQGPARREAARGQVVHLRRRRPPLRRGRLALQRLRRPRPRPAGPRARTRRSS